MIFSWLLPPRRETVRTARLYRGTAVPENDNNVTREKPDDCSSHLGESVEEKEDITRAGHSVTDPGTFLQQPSSPAEVSGPPEISVLHSDWSRSSNVDWLDLDHIVLLCHYFYAIKNQLKIH